MKLSSKILIASVCGAVAATPLLAQQNNRPSRECVREIVQLCGRDRSQIRSCLAEKYAQLSDKCSAELQSRMQQRSANGAGRGGVGQAKASKMPDRAIIYGTHQRQQIDFYAADGTGDAASPPLIVFVHGGGWSFGSHKQVQQKPTHFTKAGYAFASAGYRVLPDAPVEEQARDIGTALDVLIAQAADLGFDPERVVLIGHSAGAHLAALVSTDPQYAGPAMRAIQGVILLDGAGYDVSANMAERGLRLGSIYDRAFGDDPNRQAALSPITHVGGPDAPNWLILYVEEREVARRQSELLGSELSSAGAEVTVTAISGTDHGRMNRELGTQAGSQQTAAVDAFLASLEV